MTEGRVTYLIDIVERQNLCGDEESDIIKAIARCSPRRRAPKLPEVWMDYIEICETHEKKDITYTYVCPVCHAEFYKTFDAYEILEMDTDDCDRCFRCGQVIDWKEYKCQQTNEQFREMCERKE